jgi:hypothetical protein
VEKHQKRRILCGFLAERTRKGQINRIPQHGERKKGADEAARSWVADLLLPAPGILVAAMAAPYNLSVAAQLSKIFCRWLVLAAIAAGAQQVAGPDSLSITTQDLPKALLWEPYVFEIEASGGIAPYHWQRVAGSLPRGFVVNEDGRVSGLLSEAGSFEFTVLCSDHSNPATSQKKQFVLTAETPLSAAWLRKAQITGQRLDGSIQVSNRSGRDLDLTFIVLAVNDIGRATAIGYQHFPLKKNTRDVELPFGDTLSPGNYVVNVDVVGEEPISRGIFRARLVSAQQTITPGP